MTTAPTAQALAERLARVVGADHVLVDRALVIGRAKAHLLPLNRTGDEVAAMVAVKQALDPDGRLGRALLPFDGSHRPV